MKNSFLGSSQDQHPFLRVQILNFKATNNQSIDLKEIKTQVELKEKHRSTRNFDDSSLRFYSTNFSKKKTK